MVNILEKKVVILAPVAEVWQSITDIKLMKNWMGAPELELEIITSWAVGSPLIIKGFHHTRFENKGVVLEYAPCQALGYNFKNSLSRLPDEAESYTVVRFTLFPQESGTLVLLTLSNFPTEAIYHHLNFYWNGTLVLLKKTVESGMEPYSGKE
jgi:uncharacterized protein YndB with AHSA1/START domain